MERIANLQIQAQHVSGPALDQVMNECRRLETILAKLAITMHPTLIQGLQKVPQDPGRLRQTIREQERQRSFDDTSLHLARSLFEQQDRLLPSRRRATPPSGQGRCGGDLRSGDLRQPRDPSRSDLAGQSESIPGSPVTALGWVACQQGNARIRPSRASWHRDDHGDSRKALLDWAA
jgi:hypothetical protein